jgi:biopolymer transport protein ExbD
MRPHDIVHALSAATVTGGSFGWIDGLAHRVIRRAARHVPEALCERLEEEWLADLSERSGRMSRLSFALGCSWAAMMIGRDHCSVTVPTSCSATQTRLMRSHVRHGTRRYSRSATTLVGAGVVCEINTTPLIDVMLVLLVTLIVSLPIMTHAVKLDLPRSEPPRDQAPPEVIDLDIDFDGTVVWNGTVVTSWQQLEGYFHSESQRIPQPEIHLRPDRRTKYDFVARVLASAQHNRMEKIGFVNTSEL